MLPCESVLPDLWQSDIDTCMIEQFSAVRLHSQPFLFNGNTRK